MSIPGQILFIFVADYIHMSASTIGAAFVCSYITVSLVQVSSIIFGPSLLKISIGMCSSFLDYDASLYCSRDHPCHVEIQDRSR